MNLKNQMHYQLDYDLFKKEIIQFEKKYNFLNKSNSPIAQVYDQELE